MKLVFNGETKRVPQAICQFDQLINYAAEVFKSQKSLATSTKLYYVDEDGDIISVTCQSDLDQAKDVMGDKIKLVFATSDNEAQSILFKDGKTNCSSKLQVEQLNETSQHLQISFLDQTQAFMSRNSIYSTLQCIDSNKQ